MSERNGIERFLADIAPFFRGRRLTYVDVGAYRGRVFRKVIASDLRVDEAHLIEPNPDSLQAARHLAADSFKGRSVDFYPVAIGSRSGRVSIHPAHSMSKAFAPVGDDAGSERGYGNDFEVDCTTLDELSVRFTDRRISLLKVDVEGYELEVLEGAQELLKEQRVDVLYIEAGMNPSATQQTYYRKIEDLLAVYGYRVFGVYEQVNEWPDDSPILRRVNIAFLSERFAQSNPYSVTRELYETIGKLESTQKELVAAQRRLSEIEDEVQTVRASEQELRKSVSKEAAEHEANRRKALEAELAASQEALERQRRELRQAVQSLRRVEQALSESVGSIRQLYREERRAAHRAEQALSEAAYVRDSTSYRLGALLVRHARSPRGWLTAPLALWRELSSFRARRHNRTNRTEPESSRETVIAPDESPVFLELDTNPRIVTVSAPDRSPRELWVTAYPDRPSVTVTLGVSLLRAAASGKMTGDELGRHRDLVMRRLRLPPGVPVQMPRVESDRLFVKLTLCHGRRNCVIKVEMRSPAPSQQQARSPDVASPRPQDASSSTPASALQVNEPAPTFSASDLQRKLWAGFAEYALPALEQLASNQAAPITERAEAAWHAACWFFVEGQYEKALEHVRAARHLSEKERARLPLCEALCLIRLERYDEARAAIERGAAFEDKNVDFQMLRSTLVRKMLLASGTHESAAEEAQLDALNEVFRSVNLAPLRKRRANEPLAISNLTADAQPTDTEQRLKISVIVPAYNAALGIEWVLESLLEQTWRNLEIIVVDDCSTDDTSTIVERVSNRDSRVRLIRQDRNGGAYAARNIGLKHATGDLITVHDSDDWSHPQRLELQTLTLLADPTLVAVKSHWVRVDENLEIIGSWRPKDTVTDLNFSSLLFHRSLVDLLGPWDNVRVSGDAEFYSRIKRVFGDHAVAKIPREKVLALALSRNDSLTRARGALHVRSLHYGVRCNYRQAYRYWHSKLTHDGHDLPFDPNGSKRKFPVPPGNDPARRGALLEYDVVVVSDLAMRGGAFISTLNYIVAARKAGKSVGIVHWRKYDLNPDAPLQPSLYDACVTHGVDILSPGDRVSAKVVLIGYPAILQHRIEPLPEIDTRNVLVIVNQYASRLTNGQDQQYDPEVARRHLRSIFGREGTWIPISNRVKKLLETDRRYPEPHPIPWHPMIDVDTWCDAPLRWRGAERDRPVIGRHGRDAYTKWPANKVALAQAYGVHQDWEVRILGGASHALALLNNHPSNWTIIPFDGTPTKAFLQDLDFYVHYPHEDYIEEFGRAVMEAMAVGIPVILPPVFADTFGDAATYASPEEVPAVVAALWSSRDEYLKRAEAGRAFVRANCDIDSFGKRLDDILEPWSPEVVKSTF